MYKGPITGTIDLATTLATQKWLHSQGFNSGPEDGKWSPCISMAIQRFLLSRGYDDVKVDAALHTAACQITPGFFRKLNGSEDNYLTTTRAFQQWLREEGEDIEIDGKFGRYTVSAWQRYLQRNKVTGPPEISLKTVFACDGGSNGTEDVTVKVGSKSAEESSVEFQEELTATIEAPLKGFTLSVEGESSKTFKSAMSRTEYKETVTTTTIHLDKPCYVYQVVVKVPTRHGVMTIPLHKHISPTPLIFQESF